MKTGILEQWRAIATNDEILTKELQQKDQHLADAFTSNMEFGTAGIRGVMGAGTNKMNIHTVAAAAEAYAQFLIKNVKGAKTKGVVVGHDNRHNSALFSETVANVLMNNGIKAYLFEGNELQPTPLVSYVIRKMKLAGGAIVTASHNPKEYNGFKVYNQLGGQLMPEHTKTIQENMAKLDVLKVEKVSTKKVNYIPSTIIDGYIKDLLDKVRVRNDQMSIKVAFSSLHGTTGKLAPRLLDEMGVNHFEVKKQMETSPDFGHTKSSNPEDAESYNKVISLARRKKADIAIVTDPDGDRIGAVVKYKRRYKYLNGNQMAALYLDYKLTQLKMSGKLPKDAYIVKSVVSGNLPSRIAEKFGVRVIEAHVGFKNIAEIIERTSGTLLMGYEESYGFIIDKDITRDKDSLQAMIGLVEMTNYYRTQNINVYDHLVGLWHQYGIHRTILISKNLDDGMTNRLLKRMSRMKMVNNHNIASIEDYRAGFNGLGKTDLVKVNLEDGSWFAIRPSGTEKSVKTYIQTVGNTEQSLMDVVVFEKEIGNFIDDNTETFDDKKWSWKAFLKYAIFTGIIIGILTFVFLKVYTQGQTGGNVWHDAKIIFSRQSKWIWASMILFIIITTFVNGVIRKRLIDLGGQKVKVRHIIISGLMGSIISYITPFAIGGDAIGYWYLRRKGFKRGPLLSSFISSTIIYQFGLILQSIILIPIGIPLYKEIMFNSSPQAHASLSLFIIGISWNIFATIMIFSLTIGKRFQEFIVRNSVIVLEWFPLVHVQDPGHLASSYQYEFSEMRNGMKRIWSKKRLITEVIFYEIVLMFFNSGAVILLSAGVLEPNLFAGPYWTQIVTSDMSSTANSLSITPGGSGTGEWLSININKYIYRPGSEIGLSGDSSTTSSAIDFIWKLISQWPMLVISSLMILTIIIGENKRNKIKKINTNNRLRNVQVVKKTNYYKWVTIPWVLIVIFYLLFVVVII